MVAPSLRLSLLWNVSTCQRWWYPSASRSLSFCRDRDVRLRNEVQFLDSNDDDLAPKLEEGKKPKPVDAKPAT